MNRWIARSLLVFSCAVIAGALVYMIRDEAPTLPQALAPLARCFEHREPEDKPDMPCLRAEVQELLETFSVRDIVSNLQSPNASATVSRNCHIIGHIIGGYAFTKAPSLEDAFDQCPANCRNACTHGVMGAGVVEELGETYPDDDIAHADLETIKEIGARYCARRDMLCHGIGHVLFIAAADYPTALDACDIVGTSENERQLCYAGVFMESTGVESLGVTESSYTLPAPDYGEPCSSIAPQFQFACFRYLPRFHDFLFARDGITDADEQLRINHASCEALQGRSRGDCFYGLGSYAYRLRETDGTPVDTRTFCERFAARDQGACILGILYSQLTTVPRLYKDSAAFCASIVNEHKQLCYSAMFQILEMKSDDTKTYEAETVCGAGKADECMRAFSEYEKIKSTLPEYFYGFEGPVVRSSSGQ